jgi:hypothetical protein
MTIKELSKNVVTISSRPSARLPLAKQDKWQRNANSYTCTLGFQNAAMMELLKALRDAPDSSDLPPHKITTLQSPYEQSFELDWDDRREQVAYLIDEDSKECHLLIDNLLGDLGF